MCWRSYDQSEDDENAHDALATLTIHDDVSDHQWTANTGASSHMTSNKGMLSHLRPYRRHESVMVGNGTLLPITHIGHTTISYGNTVLPLKNVLVVPDLERNLLSIGQLTANYPLNCDFFGASFVIKERDTKKILLKRK